MNYNHFGMRGETEYNKLNKLVNTIMYIINTTNLLDTVLISEKATAKLFSWCTWSLICHEILCFIFSIYLEPEHFSTITTLVKATPVAQLEHFMFYCFCPCPIWCIRIMAGYYTINSDMLQLISKIFKRLPLSP